MRDSIEAVVVEMTSQSTSRRKASLVTSGPDDRSSPTGFCEMLLRLLGMLWRPSVMKGADRLLRCYGVDAINVARHAVQAHDEQNWHGYWTSILREVERRSNYRPF